MQHVHILVAGCQCLVGQSMIRWLPLDFTNSMAASLRPVLGA